MSNVDQKIDNMYKKLEETLMMPKVQNLTGPVSLREQHMTFSPFQRFCTVKQHVGVVWVMFWGA